MRKSIHTRPVKAWGNRAMCFHKPTMDDIIQRREDGQTYYTIGKAYGVSADSIRKNYIKATGA